VGDWGRPLTDAERQRVAAARDKCRVLYEGVRTPHRSCGIAIAETFGLPSAAYQALRRGGITGEGECGSVVAGRLVLGQLLGDPDPTGPVTDALRQASEDYADLWRVRIDRGPVQDSVICNDLTAPYADFHGAPRAAFCAGLTAEVAALVAEVLLRNGVVPPVPPIADLDWRPAGGWPPGP